MSVLDAQVYGTFALSPAAFFTIGPDAPNTAIKLAAMEPYVSVDIETAGLDELAMGVKCVTISSKMHAAILNPRDEMQAAAIRDAIGRAKMLLFHNSTFDVPIMIRNGLMAMEDIAKVVDTLIYARLAEPDETMHKGLGFCNARYLGGSSEDGMSKAFKTLGLTKAEGYRVFDLNKQIFVFGAAEDGLVTAAIYPHVVKAAARRLSNQPFGSYGVSGDELRRLIDREQRINRMLLRRAAVGLRVDYDFLDNYSATTIAQNDQDEAMLRDYDVRPGNAASLIEFLQGNGSLPDDYPRTAKTKRPSTAKGHLEELAHPVAQAYVRCKERQHILHDYLDKVVDLSGVDGRIHPMTSLLGATTGRMSMGSPPLQQFPEDARGIILADEGDTMVSIDWAAIEPCVISNVARDADILAAYESGADFYAPIVAAAGVSRKVAKVVVLASLYGLGHEKLCRDIGCDEEEGWAIKRAVFKPMPRVEALVRKLKSVGQAHQMIFTMSGRIVPVPSNTYGVATHKAVNYFTQGSAYDVLAETLIACDDAGLGDAIYLTLHDELVVSSAAAHDIRKIMETPPERLITLAGRVPVLRTDLAVLGDRWGVAE